MPQFSCFFCGGKALGFRAFPQSRKFRLGAESLPFFSPRVVCFLLIFNSWTDLSYQRAFCKSLCSISVELAYTHHLWRLVNIMCGSKWRSSRVLSPSCAELWRYMSVSYGGLQVRCLMGFMGGPLGEVCEPFSRICGPFFTSMFWLLWDHFPFPCS